MPFRTDEHRTTIHFLTFAEMPHLVYEACVATGTPSNTRYVQEAVCAKLAAETDADYDDLVSRLPPTRNRTGAFNGQRAVGPANTVEEVM